MSARATDAELVDLLPIIEALVEHLCPHVFAPMFRKTHVAGGAIRQLVIPSVDVDVIALARFMNDWIGRDEALKAIADARAAA